MARKDEVGRCSIIRRVEIGANDQAAGSREDSTVQQRGNAMNEPQDKSWDRHAALDMAAVRALIERLQPGEMLKYDQTDDCDPYYARVVLGRTYGEDREIECVSICDLPQCSVSAMIDDMIAAGELEETSFCSHWAKPISPILEKD